MKITYDREVDALYIQLREIQPGQAENKELAEGVVGDFGPDGLLSGLEILDVSRILGVNRERVVEDIARAWRGLKP